MYFQFNTKMSRLPSEGIGCLQKEKTLHSPTRLPTPCPQCQLKDLAFVFYILGFSRKFL